MKTLIKILLILVPFSSFAGGVSGGGTGPRPTDNFFVSGGSRVGTIVEALPISSGDRQGGGCWMSAMNMQSTPSKMDYVKSLGVNEAGYLKFMYKGFDSELVKVHAIKINELDIKYIEAIKRSENTDHWEAVPVEDAGN